MDEFFTNTNTTTRLNSPTKNSYLILYPNAVVMLYKAVFTTKNRKRILHSKTCKLAKKEVHTTSVKCIRIISIRLAFFMSTLKKFLFKRPVLKSISIVKNILQKKSERPLRHSLLAKLEKKYKVLLFKKP